MKPSGSGIRLPAVAGYFYPASKGELLQSIKDAFQNTEIGPGITFPDELKAENKESKSRVHCFVVPHAGYEYSGAVAAHSFLKISRLLGDAKFEAIILGPNHYGLGSGVALSPDSSWLTPLGEVKVDQSLRDELADSTDILDSDSSAHAREHSIEVQLPFLIASCRPHSFSFVPISMMMQDNETSKDLAEGICNVINSPSHEKERFLILASSDLTHYEPQPRANQKDQKLLGKVSELDATGFYSVLERDNITACGYGPIATAIRVSKKFGGEKSELLKYATSGDTTGDMSAVVGYSAVQLL